MSKNINVNPGQYKVAGRERPGEDVPEPERAKGNSAQQGNTAPRGKSHKTHPAGGNNK